MGMFAKIGGECTSGQDGDAEAAESRGGHAPGAGSHAGNDVHARYQKGLREDVGDPAAKAMAIAGSVGVLVVIAAISLGVNALAAISLGVNVCFAAHRGAAKATRGDGASAAEPAKLSALMEPKGAGGPEGPSGE